MTATILGMFGYILGVATGLALAWKVPVAAPAARLVRRAIESRKEGK